ncbi:hypothetical protein GCM10020219_065720 [Nonomuraea dietziae]
MLDITTLTVGVSAGLGARRRSRTLCSSRRRSATHLGPASLLTDNQPLSVRSAAKSGETQSGTRSGSAEVSGTPAKARFMSPSRAARRSCSVMSPGHSTDSPHRGRSASMPGSPSGLSPRLQPASLQRNRSISAVGVRR